MTILNVVYGDTKVTVPANTKIEELKVAMQENFPELEDATVVKDGDTITFTAKAGTKGAGNMEKLEVIYGDTKVEVPAGTKIDELKVAMQENFPELEDANVVVTETQVIFTAKAGTKGLDVIYGDTKVAVPDNTKLNELRVAMEENFPELENADVVVTETEVIFTAKAGTKGLDVIYGDTKVAVPDGTDIKSLRVAMEENFPELENASVIESESDNTVTFIAKAGTKGFKVMPVLMPA